MRKFIVALAVAFSAACSGSPLAPDSPDANAHAPQAILYKRTGVGPVTLELPAGLYRIGVEVKSEENACHYFEVFIAQRLVKSGILGTCTVASGLTDAGDYEVAGSIGARLDIRGVTPDHNLRPFAWTIEERR